MPPRRQTPGGRGEPEGRAVPHTHLLFLTQNLSVVALTHTHTSFLPSLHTQFLNFSLFLLFSFLTRITFLPMRETPCRCPRVRRRLRIPGCLATGTARVEAWKPKVPSFISSRFGERTSGKFLGKKKIYQRITEIKGNQVEIRSVCVCPLRDEKKRQCER